MICLRCGYCCHRYMVVIVDDPDKGIKKDNLISHDGNGPCKHLEGTKPGEYFCKVHSKKWYKETPCYSHGQIEKNVDCNCRLGEYIINNNLTY